jgi:flagellin
MSVINTNISSMQAQNSVRTQGLNLSTAMERLSSGLRINSAKDDAAGLAISTRMTASIRGISAAIRNANDGISLTQTAEGSLAQIGDNLQRIRELAVQSANSGNNASDRAAMNNEAKQLIAEIDRVASNTTYNGIKLLDGSYQGQDLQVGAGNGSNDRISISIGNAKANALGVGGSLAYETKVAGAAVGTAALLEGALAINGTSVGASAVDGVSFSGADSSAIAVAAAINAVSGTTGVTATAASTNTSIVQAGTASSLVTGFATALSAGDIKINGVSIGAVAASADATARGAALVTAINLKTGDTGVTAAWTSAAGVALTSTSGKLQVELVATAVNTVTGLSANYAGGATTSSYGGTSVTTLTAITAGDVKINGVDIGYIGVATDAKERGAQVAAAINAKTSQTGVTATYETTNGRVALQAADGRNITTVTGATGGAALTGLTAAASTTETIRSTIALKSASVNGIQIADISGVGDTAAGLTVGLTAATISGGSGVATLDLSTTTGSQAALTTLDKAINTITDSRASMGAYQNRLTASISNLETTSMNLSASRSRILDTDYAKETTNLAKSQIIQQAATAMLAQANQSGQSVLALLK